MSRSICPGFKIITKKRTKINILIGIIILYSYKKTQTGNLTYTHLFTNCLIFEIYFIYIYISDRDDLTRVGFNLVIVQLEPNLIDSQILLLFFSFEIA